MAVSIKSLLAPLDKAAVLADLYTALGLLLGYPLTLNPGEPIPAVLDVVVGWIVDSFWNPIVLPALQAVFLDYSTGDWLSLVAWLIYNRPRILAQSATGQIVVENHSGAFSGTIAVGQVRIKHSTTGKTYTNTTSGSVSAYVSGGFPVPPSALMAYQVLLTFEADEVGSASNANPGDISTTPVSAPTGIFVQTNASPMLGSDAETDPNLVARARTAGPALSQTGPLKAYFDAATDPVGAFTRRRLTPPAAWGTAAPAISRVLVQQPGGAIVNVWLASLSGPAGGTAGDPSTDVGKANVVCQLFIVPAGITCNVAPAITQNLNLGTITLDVSAESLVTADEATTTATAALDSFFQALPIGGARKAASVQGYVFQSALFGALASAPGVVAAYVSGVTGDVPVGGNAVVVPAWATPIVVNIVSQGN